MTANHCGHLKWHGVFQAEAVVQANLSSGNLAEVVKIDIDLKMARDPN